MINLLNDSGHTNSVKTSALNLINNSDLFTMIHNLIGKVYG